MALALDRQERGLSERSAVQELEAQYGVRCVTILTLSELITALSGSWNGPGAPHGRAARGDARPTGQVRRHELRPLLLARGATRVDNVATWFADRIIVVCAAAWAR